MDMIIKFPVLEIGIYYSLGKFTALMRQGTTDNVIFPVFKDIS